MNINLEGIPWQRAILTILTMSFQINIKIKNRKEFIDMFSTYRLIVI
jgi:hypothetical protein